MRILFIVLAFLIAAATAWWVSGQLKNQEIVETRIEKKVVKESSTGVLVAAETIPSGTMIKAGDLVFRSWPDSAAQENKSFIINNGSITPGNLVGAVARQDIPSGLPITNRLLIKPGEQGFLSAVLKPGMRAVAIPVNKRTGVSNLVVPGDLVDLVLTSVFREMVFVEGDSGDGLSREQKEVRVGETIAKNVRVLSVGEYLSKPQDRKNSDDASQNRSQKEATVETITVELPPKMVEAVTLANQMGEITVAVTPIAKENEELDGLDIDDPASIISGVTDKGFKSVTIDTEVSRALESKSSNSDGSKNSVIISRGGSKKQSETVRVLSPKTAEDERQESSETQQPSTTKMEAE